MKKQLFCLIAVLLLAMPIAFADTQTEESSCGIFNFIQCLKDTAYLFSYSTGLAAQPLINLVKTLMIEPPNISLFTNLWLWVIGLIGIFYIFFLLYSGITFIVAGDNLVKRYEAKESIKNMILAIILVSASFYLYELAISLNTSLTTYAFSQINPNFFTVTSDSIANAILQVLMILVYVLVLLLTSIFFIGRWLAVSFGIIFMPIGIFMYFVPFLKNYGKLIINLSLLLIFIPFISSLILLGASMLATAPILNNFSILFYIDSFLIIDFIFYMLIKFVMRKSSVGESFGALKTAIATGVKLL
jgi:hypothetical protein